MSAIPVGFAHPCTKPKWPGLAVSNQSVNVKLPLFRIGSSITIIPSKKMKQSSRFTNVIFFERRRFPFRRKMVCLVQALYADIKMELTY